MTIPFASRRTAWIAAVSIAMVSVSGCSAPMMSGSMTGYAAKLSGTQEVPPTESAGTGTLEATFDKSTSVLKWHLVYSGLTGPATMAHFHGPAMMGANAGVVVPFPNATSPVDGQATLSPAQVADLTAGKWYVNVHSQRYTGGEIRGQLMPK